MKKSIIIVVIIALVILGLFIWSDKRLDTNKAILQEQKDVQQEKLHDFILNDVVLKTALALDGGNDDGVIREYISKVETQYKIDVEYFTYSTNLNFVVRAREINSGGFYCLDTIMLDAGESKPKIINSTNGFTDESDCNGDLLI